MKSINELLIAHRGESYDAPENTLASVNLAWERGALAVEVDVHLSKDMQIVVIHDSTTTRTAGRAGKIKNQSLEELKKLDVGSFKGNKWKGEKIPLLSEVMATVPHNTTIIVEIKCGREIIPYLKNVIENSNLNSNQIIFIAFNFKTICAVKKEFPNHKAHWLMLLDYIPINRWYPYNPKRIAQKIKKHGLDGINIWAGIIATKDFIRRIKQEDLSVYLWVVNDPIRARQFIDYGVDGIATDRAAWMKGEIGLID